MLGGGNALDFGDEDLNDLDASGINHTKDEGIKGGAQTKNSINPKGKQ